MALLSLAIDAMIFAFTVNERTDDRNYENYVPSCCFDVSLFCLMRHPLGCVIPSAEKCDCTSIYHNCGINRLGISSNAVVCPVLWALKGGGC
jgi:hypothetical protein